jgi:hypothetical protein
MSGASLSVPGVLYVGPSEEALAVLHVGPSAGWVALKGIRTWSREILVVQKADVTEALRKELGVTLPEAHPQAASLANARRAAQASPLVAVESAIAEKLAAKGVRVHTIGSDRITGGFYYFAEGGSRPPVRVQGNLVDMVAPALDASADNAAVEASLDGVIDRALVELSDGVLHEAQIELAAALPALGEDAGEAAVKLQTLEGFVALAANRASKYEERARAVVEALGRVKGGGEGAVVVPLFGDAHRAPQPEIEVEYAEGASGEPRKRKLPARNRWLVAGLQSETMPPPAVAKVDDGKAAAERAAAEKAAREKAAAEKAAAEKAAAEKAAAEKAAAEKAAAEKAAAEKAAAEKAAAEKAAAEKAAAEKAAAEKAAAEKAAAEKAAEQKKADDEKAAAAKKAATEKKDGDKKAAQPKGKGGAKKGEEKAKPAEKAAAKPAAASAASKTAAARGTAAASKGTPAKTDEPRRPAWVWLLLLLVAVGAVYYVTFVRHHH